MSRKKSAKKKNEDGLDPYEILESFRAVDAENVLGFKTPKEKCNNLEIIKPRKILASLHAAEFLPLKIPDADCKWLSRREKYVVDVLRFLKSPSEAEDETGRKLVVKTCIADDRSSFRMFGNHGVYAVEDIEEGTIIEYCGVLRLAEEHDALVKRDPFCLDQFYVWDIPAIDLPKGSDYKKVKFCIAGWGQGNLTALVNDPSGFSTYNNKGEKVPASANLVMLTLIWKGIPRLLYVANKRIPAGEQLFLSYLDNSDERVLESTNEVVRWSFLALLLRNSVDPSFAFPETETYLKDLLDEDDREKEESKRFERHAKSVATDNTTILDIEVVDSWLPADFHLPKIDKNRVQDLSESVEEEKKNRGGVHMKTVVVDKPLRKPIEDKGYIYYRITKPLLIDMVSEEETNGKKGKKKKKRTSLDDFDPSHGAKRIKLEDGYQIKPESYGEFYGYSESKGFHRITMGDDEMYDHPPMKQEVKQEGTHTTSTNGAGGKVKEIIVIPDEKRFAFGKWMRADNNLNYEVSEDLSSSDDSDFNFGLNGDLSESNNSDEEEMSRDVRDDGGIITIEDDDFEDGDQINIKDYDSDYEGPPEDGAVYRLVDPKEGQLVQIRAKLDSMWYSARIRYVFRENGREYVKVKFEGFSKAYDETVPTDMLNKFRPHLGPETSADSQVYRFGYVKEPEYATVELVDDPDPYENDSSNMGDAENDNSSASL